MSVADSDTTQAWNKGMNTAPDIRLPGVHKMNNPSQTLPAPSSLFGPSAIPGNINIPPSIPPMATSISPPSEKKMTKIDLIVQQFKEDKRTPKMNVAKIDIPKQVEGCADNEKKNQWFKKVIENPAFIAFCAGLVVLIVLVALNPPFVQKRVDNPIHKGSPDLVKALIYSIIIAGGVYVLPLLVDKITKSK